MAPFEPLLGATGLPVCWALGQLPVRECSCEYLGSPQIFLLHSSFFPWGTVLGEGLFKGYKGRLVLAVRLLSRMAEATAPLFSLGFSFYSFCLNRGVMMS